MQYRIHSHNVYLFIYNLHIEAEMVQYMIARHTTISNMPVLAIFQHGLGGKEHSH